MKTLFILLFFLYACEKIENPNVFIDDRDGNEYEYAEFGDQIWMLENLRYNPNSNLLIDNEVYYSFDKAQSSCPYGWHIPTNDEWKQLKEYIGTGEELIIGEFNADLVGWYQSEYAGDHEIAAWWTSTECFNDYGWVYYIRNDLIKRTNLRKESLLTVRLIRD